MSGEVHSPLIHHALREVGGIGRIVRREYTEELVPAGDQAVVVADVREELERRCRGRDGGEDDVLGRREAVPGLLQAGGPLEQSRDGVPARSEEHTSEIQSRPHLVWRLLPLKKK